MLITILNQSRRNALADMYKNIVNVIAVKNKFKIAAVIPKEYDVNEYNNFFYKKIVDELSCAGKFKKFYLIIKLVKEIKEIFCRAKKRKILFFHENAWMNIVIYLLLLNKNIDYYVWIHDPIVHLGENKRINIIRWLAFHTYIKKAKYLMVGYEEGKRILKDKYKINEKNILVLYLPQLRELEFEKIKRDKSIEIKYDFIFYGNIEKYKGIDLLVDVFKSKDLNNIKLLIVGRGKEDKKIKKIVDEMKNVTFINRYVSNEDLAKYIMQSRYVILPYITATGSQTVQIANYYEKMVLATRVGCFLEYVKEGENGYFIDNNTKEDLKKYILKYYNVKPENNQKEKIKKMYNKFDIENISLKLYNMIIKS